MIQELISVGFAVEFVLDHLREVARAFFMRRVQPAVDAIDACIELLKKEVANLKGCREHLLSGIGRPSRFGDRTPLMMVRFSFLFFPVFIMLHRTLICFLQ